ncbi:MAG: 30S ribosomal protein S9 [Myxococcota bacterium]
MGEKYYATGRRKEATARVYLIDGGAGKILINNRKLEDYFGRLSAQMALKQPLDLTGTLSKFDVDANVVGGGLSGQAEAVRHGIARALLKVSPEFRSPLKRAGLLTRDPREVERKKYGRPKARKRFQYSKR